ncbi:DNA translocase FtsK [Virgibacillus sp. C22-A2]|uniref:DNA translocase FtsK n=1 Tax=Virgibacillus tibetensis TaxID=3042313 RepID=A0ABU6KBR1_9BACI|nr:DNA translocase FtsK [Virgibacillus sp. C22-A2]
MWDQWIKKLKALFTEEDKEEQKRNINQENQNLQAKMMYQYPEDKTFRFPVIPDQKTKETPADVPAFQRKRNKSLEENRTPHQTRKREYPNLERDKVYKKNTEIPFQLTEVPSPIYGFQQKRKEKEVESIPAYKRKQDKIGEQHEPVDKEELIISKTKEAVNQNADSLTEAASTVAEEFNQEIKNTDTEQEWLHKRNKKNKSPGSKDIKNKKNSNKSVSPKQEPYNVIMTPRDKKNLYEKAKLAEKKAVVKEQTNLIPYHLLNDAEQKSSEDNRWVIKQQNLLEETLRHFNVKAKVVKATQGPSVTRFEVQPELGVKVSKVKNLSDDLKLNMAAKDIRIEAPIPGKNTIGIEIPNPKPQMVGLQGIFESEEFKNCTYPLPIALGLSIEGSPLITSIQKMPHGLIAGATGSGKSVCINTILISLLYKATHEDVKFLLIDPKMVELAPYNGIPHLVAPVITNVKAATVALKWAVNEMEERYEKFVYEGVRDIERYNQKVVKQDRMDEKMPFIVIVIDELADLMMVSPQDVEDSISRIAQKARACGIHLLLATQRPSVDVITGLIKANIPTRIAFSVSSQIDSRTILDTSGAEKLLGKGDMLFIENGTGKSIRLQGPFVSDEEIERVTSYARSIAEPNYLFEQEQLLEQINVDEDEDILLHEAIEFVLQQNSASTSLLQRQFKIGYNRAARLVDTLERRGIISQQNGSKPRDVLVSSAQIEETQ